ncbi:MAG: hypothetical protein ABR907_08830 [Terracidiphilus sp.]|jgi:hypothetical protein
MENQYGRPMEGERHTPKYPRDYPALPSGLQPLPFYPNLKRELRSVTGALVLTYLEIYHPPLQDSSGALLGAPVTLHLDQISEDLQISRRTLFTALCVLAARWGSEEAWARAARAGREFLNPAHTINGRTKFYSLTGAIGYLPHTTVQLRRNFPLISFMLQKAGITSLVHQEFIGIDHFKTLDAAAISAPTAHIPAQKEAPSEILLRTSVLAGDRRSTRYPRLRAAVGAGLLPASALNVRRNAG